MNPMVESRVGDGLVQSTSTNWALCPPFIMNLQSTLPTHSESRAQEASRLFCQILELTRSQVTTDQLMKNDSFSCPSACAAKAQYS